MEFQVDGERTMVYVYPRMPNKATPYGPSLYEIMMDDIKVWEPSFQLLIVKRIKQPRLTQTIPFKLDNILGASSFGTKHDEANMALSSITKKGQYPFFFFVMEDGKG